MMEMIDMNLQNKRRRGQTDRRADSIQNQIDRAIYDALYQARPLGYVSAENLGNLRQIAKNLCAKIAALQMLPLLATVPDEDEYERNTAHDDYGIKEVADIIKKKGNDD